MGKLCGLAGSIPGPGANTKRMMTLRAARRCTIPLVTLAIAFTGVAGVASADDAGVISAIKHQASSLAANPEIRKLQHFDLKTAAEARKAIPVLRTVEGKLRHAANVVSRTHGSSTAGRAGKTEWVAGVRQLAFGYGQLVGACQDIEKGSVSSSNSEARRAVKSLLAAGRKLTKADTELKQAAAGG